MSLSADLRDARWDLVNADLKELEERIHELEINQEAILRTRIEPIDTRVKVLEKRLVEIFAKFKGEVP